VIVPLLINTLLFAGLIALGGGLFDGLMERLLPETVGWLEWLLWPIFAVVVIVISFYSFTLVANLLGAPFNDRLAEKVAERLGTPLEGARSGSLLAEAGAAMLGELRKWVYCGILMIGLVILWLIPVVNLLAAPLWLVLSAWMLCVEYGDYPLVNSGLAEFSQRRAWLRRRRWSALGFGAATLGATMIPVVNFAVMPAAVAGATVLWHQTRDSD